MDINLAGYDLCIYRCKSHYVAPRDSFLVILKPRCWWKPSNDLGLKWLMIQINNFEHKGYLIKYYN